MKIPVKKFSTEKEKSNTLFKIELTKQELEEMQKELNRLELSENIDVLKTKYAEIKQKKAFKKSEIMQLKNALKSINMQHKILYNLKTFINFILKK